MARSFALRQQTGVTGYGTDGSQLRNTGADAALRADGVVSLPANAAVAYLNAAPISYDTVELQWNVVVAGGTSWNQLVIVASQTGHPTTSLDGRTVVTYDNNATIYTANDVGLTPGRWYYYSLFIRIHDVVAGYDYYYRIATADALVPVKHGNTDRLYNKIPEFYRIQDAALGTTSTPGPLYRFVEMLGYEVDFTQTLLDTVRNIRNISQVPVSILPNVIDSLGLTAMAEGISETRARYLAQNIMHLRAIKGTIAGIRGYISALSGYQTDITVISPTRIDIRVWAQRVNFIKNPKFAGLTSWTTAANTGGCTVSASSNQLNVVSGAGASSVEVKSNSFTVLAGRAYGAGFRIDQIPTNSSIAFYMDWFDGATTTRVQMPIRQTINNGTSVQRVTTDAIVAPANTVSSTFVIKVTFTAGSLTVKGSQAIVEPGPVGDYFDGDTKSGGFLPGATGQFDFRWDTTIDNSYSYYNLDFGVSQKVILNALQYMVPVGITVGGSSGYTISDWTSYPGKP